MKTNHSRNLALVGLFAAALLLTQLTAQAGIAGPYAAAANTLHLWHMDASAVPVPDEVVTGGTNLVKLLLGATLSAPAYSAAFGTALSTLDGGQDNTAGTAKDAYVTTSSSTDTTNVSLTLADPTTGAFTMEALVWIGFDPAKNLGTIGNGGNGRTIGTSIPGVCQILSGDGNTNANRVFQFRISPIDTDNPINAAVQLQFVNINLGGSQKMTTAIPTTGPDAILSNSWYHVAVTYNGNEGTADNLTFYWTLLDPSRTNANAIGTASMTHDLPVAPTIFAVGNDARNSTAIAGNLLGYIDEVRISSIARASGAMMFNAVPPQPVITGFSYYGAGPSLILSGTNGIEGNTYYVVASTNVAAPLSNWQPVFTNTFGANGVFSVTNAVSGAIPARFYRLQLP
jgi:hypothetical protein